MSLGRLVLAMILVTALLQAAAIGAADQTKAAGVFYSASLRDKAASNAAKFPWAAQTRDEIVNAAAPFLEFSDAELWNLIFGNTLKRSWMVWSNGFCPACKKSVPMYTWEMDALAKPWKTRCPHCKEVFPKNDFHKFYVSGLDERGIFDPKRADRSLLFNVEHPDPKDPLHMFGVDDGEGYFDGTNRWWFIAAYLIYGQWKQLIVGGAEKLAAAYVVTGDRQYAHRAGVLLDRVGDLYPTYDFKREGVMYEGPAAAGYVSTWHDACWETRQLALSYDQVFDGIKDDPKLQAFLAAQSKKHKLDNPKASFANIQRNIEDRILRDALANSAKTRSNFPQTDITFTLIKAILGWPANRAEVMSDMDEWLTKATAVDGITGEKGLNGYATLSPQNVGSTLELFARMDPSFLKDVLARHPSLHEGYRFHIDTRCLGQYYPTSGDCGSFAFPGRNYYGLTLNKRPGITPSAYSFLWRLYEQTKDPAFAQVLYNENGGAVEGLPYDLFADDPAAFQKSVSDAINRVGSDIKLGSLNKQQWHMGIMRSGEGKDARAMWLDYDAGGGHGHADGMTLGLFARGLDLMPDFGYPPVQYGGWTSPRARWYTMTAAHNTVVVDGAGQKAAQGKTTLWADGKTIHAIRASAPELYGEMKQYERTAALIDISDKDCYAVDIFRVVGGKDHAKFLYSHFGTMTPTGLTLQPAPDYGFNTLTRGFRSDPSPHPGWSADWKIDDRYKLLPPGTDVHLRYTDLTAGATALLGEGWVSVGLFDRDEEAWIPCVVTRRQADTAPLASTFVGVIEPYEKRPSIASIHRLPLQSADGKALPDANVALEIQLADGRNDLFVVADVENDGALLQNDAGLRLDGDMCVIRRDKSGNVVRIGLSGASVSMGGVALKLKPGAGFVEIEIKSGKAVTAAGQASDIESVIVGEK